MMHRGQVADSRERLAAIRSWPGSLRIGAVGEAIVLRSGETGRFCVF